MKNIYENKQLNHIESIIMYILWEREKASSREIHKDITLQSFSYSTLSFYLRLLENKGFVGHHRIGNTYFYFPQINRDDYLAAFFEKIANLHFKGDNAQMLIFLKGRLNR